MKNSLTRLLIGAVVLCTSFASGCMKGIDTPTPEETLKIALQNVDQAKLQSDLKVIDDSLAKWNLTPNIEPQGVRYVVHTAGTGTKPKLTSQLKLTYSGKLLTNKKEFDGAENITFPFQLKDLILGWQTTLPLLPAGTKATLYIPSGLAYGPNEVRDGGLVIIPANSNLIFEIELIDVL